MSSIQRRLALLIGAALLAMAVAAPGAMAMEVRDAETEELCSEVSPPVKHEVWSKQSYESGGCTVHMTAINEPTYFMTVLGGPIDQCYVGYDIHVGPDGWGFVDGFEYGEYGAGSGAGCWWWKMRPTNLVPAGSGGSWPHANSDTDFNFFAYAEKPNAIANYQFVSLDATESNPLLLDNQLNAAPQQFFSGGQWQGGTGLLITH
jgi:hypothetical protein